jgi:outer membrane receptor protein involved in Fe transport
MEKFILMQDGFRISSPTNEPLMVAENMPLYMVKQVEMVSSSASALYGADALAGVINLITYKPEEINGVRAGVRSGMYDYYSGHVLFGKRIGQVGLRLGANYFHDGNYALPRFYPKEFEGLKEYERGTFSTMFGPMTPSTPFNPRYEFRRLGYSFDALVTYEDWNFNVSRHSARHPTSVGYVPTNAIYNHSAFYEQSVTKISAAYVKKVGDRIDLQTNLMTSIYELGSKSNFRNVYSGMEPGYKFGFGTMGYFEQVINYNTRRWKLTGGAVYQPYFSTPKGEDLDRPVNISRTTQAYILGSDVRAEYFSLRYDNFGAFGQAIFKPNEKWALTAGARYDYNTRYYSTFNPRAGVVFNPNDRVALKVFYGSAFYAPSPLDAYDQYGSFVPVQDQFGRDSSWKSFFRHLANPGLKPVVNRNLEFIYSHNIGDFRLALTAYVMFLENLYYEANDAKTLNLYNGQDRGYSVDFIEVRVNNGKQTNYGGHLDLQYRARWGTKLELTAFVKFGFLDGEQDFFGQKQNIPYISRFQQRTGFLFVYDKFSAHASLVAMSEQRTVIANPENPYRHLTLPGYHTLDVNFSYRILPYLRLYVEFENLTNQKFYHPNRFITPADFFGVPQMPFRFFGGADFNLNFKEKNGK